MDSVQTGKSFEEKGIEVIINGLRDKIPEGSTISDLISLFNEYDVHLIVEYNGRFLYPQGYPTTRLSAGDRVEFINPNFGG